MSDATNKSVHKQVSALRQGGTRRGARSGLPRGCVPCGSSTALGYSDEERSAPPAGADLGLGCGNPQGFAALRLGKTVLDLGSGAGFDCFLASETGGPGRPGHRCGHDAGHGYEGANERREHRGR